MNRPAVPMLMLMLMLAPCACRHQAGFGGEGDVRDDESEVATESAKDEPKRPDLEGLEPASGLTVLDLPPARDVGLDARVELGWGAGSVAGLAVRVAAGAGSYYLGRLVQGQSDVMAQLLLVQGGKPTLLKEAAVDAVEGRLRLEVKGRELTLLLEGQPLVKATDATLAGAGKLGYVADEAQARDFLALPSQHVGMRSSWEQTCGKGAAATGAAPVKGGWTSWSEGIVTSDWTDAAPWSCFGLRLYSGDPRLRLTAELRTEWRSDCTKEPTATALAGSDGAWTPWSPPLITSQWDGAPWTCLSARVKGEGAGGRKCKVALKSEWRSDCQTGVVESEADGWTPWLVTSRWMGAPWSCLSARVACE